MTAVKVDDVIATYMKLRNEKEARSEEHTSELQSH